MTDHRYHVFVQLKTEENMRALALDLSKQDVQKKVCKPYVAGGNIFVSSVTTSSSEIRRLEVVRSALASQDELRRIVREHEEISKITRETGQMILGPWRGNDVLDLLEDCENVTADFIKDSPGAGTIGTKIYALLHNQWVTGVGLLVIGVLIGRYFGVSA